MVGPSYRLGRGRNRSAGQAGQRGRGEVPGCGKKTGAAGLGSCWAYLFVGKAQLVLKDDAAIVQALGLIGQRIEGIGEALGELEVRHAHAEGWRIKLDEEALLVGDG